MKKRKAMIVTALAGFVRSFLTHDIELLQGMGDEVHCAANIHHPGAEGMEEYFREHGVVFHQIVERKLIYYCYQYEWLPKKNSGFKNKEQRDGALWEFI